MPEPKGTRRPSDAKAASPDATAEQDAAKAREAIVPNGEAAVDAAAAGAPVDDASAEAGASAPHEHVAERAYHKFLARGGEHGRDADDWAEAERELLSERSSGTKRRPKKRR